MTAGVAEARADPQVYGTDGAGRPLHPPPSLDPLSHSPPAPPKTPRSVSAEPLEQPQRCSQARKGVTIPTFPGCELSRTAPGCTVRGGTHRANPPVIGGAAVGLG